MNKAMMMAALPMLGFAVIAGYGSAAIIIALFMLSSIIVEVVI